MPSQAFQDTAFDMRLNQDNSRFDNKTDQQKTSQGHGNFEMDSQQEAGVKKEKLD